MSDYDKYALKIDEGFRCLIPPLSSEERRQLEENIINDGCREPLCVWNKTILDGHNRYEICRRLSIPFKITYIFLRSREEAVAWICANQLGRRNITAEARRYLIGKRYEMEKIIGAHNAAGTTQYTRKEVRSKMFTEPLFYENANRTRERLGKEYCISPATIAKYGDYSQSLDTLSRVEPALLPRILSGRVKISQKNVAGLSKLLTADIRRISSDMLEDDVAYSHSRGVVPKKKEVKKNIYPPTSTVSVKDMPHYDPDADILSLSYTIPSWISSIDRTQSAAKFKETSNTARIQLEKTLDSLMSAVETMLLALKEENNGAF